MFRWSVKFRIGIIELITDFPQPVIVTAIIVWLVRVVAEMYISQYVEKAVMFHYVTEKWCTELS
jgi:hypothetical protein